MRTSFRRVRVVGEALPLAAWPDIVSANTGEGTTEYVVRANADAFAAHLAKPGRDRARRYAAEPVGDFSGSGWKGEDQCTCGSIGVNPASPSPSAWRWSACCSGPCSRFPWAPCRAMAPARGGQSNGNQIYLLIAAGLTLPFAFLALKFGSFGVGRDLGEGSGSFLFSRPRSRAFFVWSDWGYRHGATAAARSRGERGAGVGHPSHRAGQRPHSLGGVPVSDGVPSSPALA